MRTILITAVEIIEVTGSAPPSRLSEWNAQVNAASIYDENRTRTTIPFGAGRAMTARYLRIGTDVGVEGLYGPIDAEAISPILQQIGPRLLGRDALAVTVTWDYLERIDRHARHGHYKFGMSAVDNALWDLRGKVFDAPVWQLLGGSSRQSIPAYASMLGTSLELERVSDQVAWAKAEGFAGQKWFLADGPADGAEGLTRNVNIARTVRESIGSEDDMMFDVFRGWDLAYAKAWTSRVAELVPTWLEEPFLPSHFAAYAELHRATPVPLAAGEHLYDRSDLVPYLDEGILAVVQSDPEWCGGVTELVRICSMAELGGVPMIAHGHNIHAALHVAASQSPALCPKVEYLVNIVPSRHHFEADPPVAVKGSVALPTRPGFGIHLDESKIDARTVSAI
jgi:L-alanine-DL-glutamate epimerase-like enolase superfamily enzyme